MIMDGMVFQAVAAPMVVISFSLGASVPYGVLPRVVFTMFGYAISVVAVITYGETVNMKEAVFLFVASEINFCDKKGPSHARLRSAERSKKDGVIY